MVDGQKSLWELESDIFTDYEGTITEATFQYNELPTGWESPDGGETIARISGDGKGITKGSQWGKFLGSVAQLPGALEALGDDAPINANKWIGTRWHFEVTEIGKGKPYDFTNDAGEKVKGVGKDKNYPVEFLGKDSASVQASTNGSGTNGKVDSLSVLFTLNDPIAQEKIKEAAKELPHKEWFSACYKIVTDAGGNASTHGDLIAAMGDRQLYESLGGKG